MQNTPLPKQVDVRKLVATDVLIEAREPLVNFARLPDMLEASDGEVEVQLHFYVDPQRTKRIDGKVRTTLMVLCQRCLKPLPLPVDSSFSVAVVWSDEEASRLPKELEPYIVGEEPQDIRELVEDELIISVPYVSYHDEGQCVADGYEKLADIVEPELMVPAETKENPFKVLEQLKDTTKKSS
jgi:DUF177 domain-containing protein